MGLGGHKQRGGIKPGIHPKNMEQSVAEERRIPGYNTQPNPSSVGVQR